jgi:hypothetical protein
MVKSAGEQQNQLFEPSRDYLARAKRIDDAMNLRKPDRVPVVPLGFHFFPTRARGVSNKDAMYTMDRTLDIWKETVTEYDWDGAPWPGGFYAAQPLEILGIKQLKWPGRDLPDDQPFQWVEGEYMLQDEYDEALADPNGYAVRKIWPRISSMLSSVSAMTQMAPPPPLLFLSASPVIQAFLGEMLSAPPVMDLLKKALDLGEVHARLKQRITNYAVDVMQLGYPIVMGSVAVTAFDWISDSFRGMKGSMVDMYRVPDKLLSMIEMFLPLTISSCLAMARESEAKGVVIPLHRGAAGFMNDKQFAKFYWPGFKALINGIVDAGLTPIPFFEGDYTPRLEYLQELPAKKVMAHFDIVDRRKAKELLGDRMVFWGNVPASLMCTGTPQQIKDDVKELIDIFGDNGGLIIDTSMAIPDESRPENVRALTEAVYEYGVY